MATAETVPYSFTAVGSGVDWITCSARGKDARRAFLHEGEAILQDDAGAGVDITSARVRDYSGFRSSGLFVGSRRDDDLIVMSGSRAAAHWQTVARAATNVSRLDLQVTVWTHGEQPALSRWYYQRCKRLPPQRGRPRSLSLIQTHPVGDTLYVGKRKSDSFGRVYDYASAHQKGEARTIWRYEVEYKRHLALNHANRLLAERVHAGAVEQLVGGWFHARGINRTWSSFECPEPQDASAGENGRDVLRWFDTSLSKTVAKAVRRYGVAAVVEALHLSQYVIERPRKESNTYATKPAQALHGDAGRGIGESANHDTLLDAWRDSLARINGGSRD